ncbi:TniB family NTP-binding protein [Alginatibacterium sediminis]|uniref:TniB family NTP-binding protein n=1 Tax=Alginatibacterium sediminis TaxID=2164068 RepID=UPI00131480D6|nr:TniB family NTP-binding protein [Alginatibacterium sediminis]
MNTTNSFVPVFGSAQPIDPRVGKIQETIIKHTRFTEGLNQISEAHRLRLGMVLDGDPGLGKTTIINTYRSSVLALAQQAESEELSPMPIMVVSIPAQATQRRLLAAMFDQFGTDAQLSSKTYEMERQVYALIENYNVEVIIFDEFHHLLRRETFATDTFNFIKLLMDRSNLAVVLAGLPIGKSALEKHPELEERLGFNSMTLTPFDINTAANRRLFQKFMYAFKEKVSLNGGKCIDFSNHETLVLERLLLATYGKPRLIRNLLVHALIDSGEKFEINIANLSRAYEKVDVNKQLGVKNPFRMKIEGVEQAMNKKLHIEKTRDA